MAQVIVRKHFRQFLFDDTLFKYSNRAKNTVGRNFDPTTTYYWWILFQEHGTFTLQATTKPRK